VAAANGIRTLAFPCISTGIYGYPIALATQIAIPAVSAAASAFSTVQEVLFCCFSEGDLAVYEAILSGTAV